MDSRGYEILSAEEVEELKKVSRLVSYQILSSCPLESSASHASMVTVNIAMDQTPILPTARRKVDNGPLP